MKPNQVHVATSAMLRNLEQVRYAVETRLARQVMTDVPDIDGHDRIDNDLSVVHAVTASHLDMRPRPDADAAPDPPASDSLAKTFGERHERGGVGTGERGLRRKRTSAKMAAPKRRSFMRRPPCQHVVDGVERAAVPTT